VHTATSSIPACAKPVAAKPPPRDIPVVSYHLSCSGNT